MARRNSNRDASGRSQGGVRLTESTVRVSPALARRVETPVDRLARMGGFTPLDLSAFEPISYQRIELLEPPIPQRVQPAPSGGYRPIAQSALNTPTTKAPSLLKAAKTPARREVMHEIRTARIDTPRCKQRPKDNRGNGGSRAFIPWCDRKR
jgi:hypothetical protein